MQHKNEEIKYEFEKRITEGLVNKNLYSNPNVFIYPDSINTADDTILFLGRINTEKKMFLSTDNKNSDIFNDFNGEVIQQNSYRKTKLCSLNHKNLLKVQKYFSFTKPVLIGLRNSFGFGDRLGIANAGHLRSLKGFNFVPILAQQSIRELTRTQRKPSDVMDAAIFSVLQEGWIKGFGADADHLKSKEDIELMLKEGFTFFTFDPSEFVNNDADTMSGEKLDDILKMFNWELFEIFFESLKEKYCTNKLSIKENNFILDVSETELKRALVKYGKALLDIKELYEYLVEIKGQQSVEVEISIDETDSVTSPFEHFFISDQLHRLGIKYVSLAPRFVGDFEKGIDYKGDIQVFESEFKKHVAILKHFGDYKISLHSGSDKFTAYKVIAKYDIPIHIKTAGTSYLEALRTIAAVDPKLFREILDYSCSLYEEEKRTYHVSASVMKTKPAAEYSDSELPELLNDDNARQILHVTYGRILTDKNTEGEYLFKKQFFNTLIKNQDLYDKYLEKHFIKHLAPFKK